ncbi:MAG: hypothetical protein HYU78_03155 [Rhodocyclales bacterium]|nr:hypothetical protein [Rhodocyclales bacterium]
MAFLLQRISSLKVKSDFRQRGFDPKRCAWFAEKTFPDAFSVTAPGTMPGATRSTSYGGIGRAAALAGAVARTT